VSRSRTERTGKPILEATAAQNGLGALPLGSARSRAAARALLLKRREAERPEIRLVVRSVVDGREIDFASEDKREESNIREVLVTPDAKDAKPRPPLKPDFDGPVQIIVDL
jgi:hypothetical protein